MAGICVAYTIEGTDGLLGDYFRADPEAIDYPVGICVLAMLSIKRWALPTRSGHPRGSCLARGAYLFSAIVGSLSVVAATVWACIEARSGAATIDPQVWPLAGGGLFLMALAACIDRLHLDRATPEPPPSHRR